MRKRFLWLMLGLTTLLIVNDCGVQVSGQELPFSSVARGSVLNPQGEENPAILVIANVQEVDNIIKQVPLVGDPPRASDHPSLVDQMRQIDYNSTFAILVRQGLKGSGGYGVTVQHVTRQGDQVFVQAMFVGPGAGEGRTGVITDPYHLVAVSKDSPWGLQIRFGLVNNGKVVAETTHFIP